MANGIIPMINHFMTELGFPSVGLSRTRLAFASDRQWTHAKRVYVSMVGEVLRIECHTSQDQGPEERHTDTKPLSQKHDIRDPDIRFDDIIGLIYDWITTP